MVIQQEMELAGQTITIETGKVARQASGAVTVRCGDTLVLVTAVISEKPLEEATFLPLTVDVEEKMYAAGKIPGGYFKREARPSEKAILTARLIDRPIRPLFAENFRNEVQIIASILSVDQINPPDVLALVGASIALTISGVPFGGPIGAVRVGHVDDRWIVNPTLQELAQSDLDLVVAGTQEAISMVEAGAREISEDVMLKAMEEAQKVISQIIDFQKDFQKKVEPVQKEISLVVSDEEIEKRVREYATDKLREALVGPDKMALEEAVATIEDETMNRLTTMLEGKERYVASVLAKIKKEEIRRLILKEGIRSDGRQPDEIRSISCDVGVLPRTHGSALFTRGQTQVLSVLTLGTVSEDQRIDGLGIEESKKYLHHYNFPPFSTGDLGFMRGPRRREIGHGALAEKALVPVLPSEEDFPYTVRVVSEVLESNGSTSMASVCGSSLSLMDAGVPLRSAVAGIAMGLVKDEKKTVILTDILGLEDAIGDMDFKVAGTEKGITALQMDVKGAHIGFDVLKEALERARQARLFILEKMNQAIAKPREKLSEYAPRVLTMTVNPEKIGDVIGPKGKTIRAIIDEVGVSDLDISIEDDGRIFISAKDLACAEKAKQMIGQIVKDVQVGDQYMGTVVKTTNFGAFVEVLPGKDGLVHISKLAKHRVPSVESVVTVGDKILVEVIEIDRQGRINLAAIDTAESKSVADEPKT